MDAFKRHDQQIKEIQTKQEQMQATVKECMRNQEEKNTGFKIQLETLGD